MILTEVIKMKTYKARLVKINRPSRYRYNVISVTSDKKHQYFIVKSKIYQHEFIETISYKNCDYIEVFENDSVIYERFADLTGGDKPAKVVNQE